jgi:hypothetical protein
MLPKALDLVPTTETTLQKNLEISMTYTTNWTRRKHSELRSGLIQNNLSPRVCYAMEAIEIFPKDCFGS